MDAKTDLISRNLLKLEFPQVLGAQIMSWVPRYAVLPWTRFRALFSNTQKVTVTVRKWVGEKLEYIQAYSLISLSYIPETLLLLSFPSFSFFSIFFSSYELGALGEPATATATIVKFSNLGWIGTSCCWIASCSWLWWWRRAWGSFLSTGIKASWVKL